MLTDTPRTLAAEILWANAIATEAMDLGLEHTAQSALQIARIAAKRLTELDPDRPLSEVLEDIFLSEGSAASLVLWQSNETGLMH